MNENDLNARKYRAADAKSLLENKLFKDAWDRLHYHLEGQAMACDPDDKDKAARIIISKQLLKGIKREFERMIEDGDIADVQIAELQTKKVTKFYR